MVPDTPLEGLLEALRASETLSEELVSELRLAQVKQSWKRISFKHPKREEQLRARRKLRPKKKTKAQRNKHRNEWYRTKGRREINNAYRYRKWREWLKTPEGQWKHYLSQYQAKGRVWALPLEEWLSIVTRDSGGVPLYQREYIVYRAHQKSDRVELKSDIVILDKYTSEVLWIDPEHPPTGEYINRLLKKPV